MQEQHLFFLIWSPELSSNGAVRLLANSSGRTGSEGERTSSTLSQPRPVSAGPGARQLEPSRHNGEQLPTNLKSRTA